MPLSILIAPQAVERNIDDYLDRAEAAFDANYFIEAGGLIREAIRRMLFGIFEYKNLPMPRRKVKRSTGELAILLKKAGEFDEEQTAYVLEILETANRASHCSFVTRDALRSALRHATWLLREFREDMPGSL